MYGELESGSVLDTFGKKRREALRLGLINAHTDDALRLVNDVRVVFAHAEEPITFGSRCIEKVAGKDARAAFEDAARCAERAIEERRNEIVYERSSGLDPKARQKIGRSPPNRGSIRRGSPSLLQTAILTTAAMFCMEKTMNLKHLFVAARNPMHPRQLDSKCRTNH
jgi:hypothetical protein